MLDGASLSLLTATVHPPPYAFSSVQLTGRTHAFSCCGHMVPLSRRPDAQANWRANVRGEVLPVTNLSNQAGVIFHSPETLGGVLIMHQAE